MTRRTLLRRLADAAVAALLPACAPAPTGLRLHPVAQLLDARRFGLVLHEEPAPYLAADALRLGARHLRWTVYAGETPVAAVRRAHYWATQGGVTLLVCVHGGNGPAHWQATVREIAAVCPGLTYQLGNEVDTGSFGDWFLGAAGPAIYAGLLAAVRRDLAAIDPSARLVTAGLGSGNPGGFLAQMGDLGAVDAVCVHAYGPPPDLALRERVTLVRRAAPTLPVWVTEVGIAPQDALRAWATPAERFGAVQARELEVALRAAWQYGVERVYGYAADGDDGYALAGATRAMLAAHAGAS